MADLGEDATAGRAADALGRRVGRHELREGRLQGDEPTEQLVVLGVADLGRVLLVVEPVRPVDLLGERRVPRRRRLDVEGGRLGDEVGVDGRQGEGHLEEGTERRGGLPAMASRIVRWRLDPPGLDRV